MGPSAAIVSLEEEDTVSAAVQTGVRGARLAPVGPRSEDNRPGAVPENVKGGGR